MNKTDAINLKDAVREWWKSRRPVGWTEKKHRINPYVNTIGKIERDLADAYLDCDTIVKEAKP